MNNRIVIKVSHSKKKKKEKKRVISEFYQDVLMDFWS